MVKYIQRGVHNEKNIQQTINDEYGITLVFN